MSETTVINPHAVQMWITGSGYFRIDVTCSASEGSPCRLWCDEGCEETCDAPSAHRKSDQGYCLPSEWVRGDDVLETYGGGKDHQAASGPITYTWDGDSYEWLFEDQS